MSQADLIDPGIEGAVDALYENARSYNEHCLALAVSKESNEELWLAARQRTIGASESAAALAVSRYKSPFQQWLEDTGQIKPKDISKNPKVIAGNRLEGVIREWFADETNRKVDRVNEMLVSKTFRFMHANLDGRVIGENAGLECKSAGHWAGLSEEWGKSGSSDSDAVPLAYLTQCMHTMIVTGWKKMYLAVLIGGNDFRWYTINFDAEVASKVVDGLNAYREKVIKAIPYVRAGRSVPEEFVPPPTTMEDVYARWPTAEPKKIKATREISELVDESAKLKRSIKEDKDRRDEIKLAVTSFMRECDTLVYQQFDDDSAVTLATHKLRAGRKTFDAKRHLADVPDCHAKYAGVSEPGRTFLLKDEAG